jgi:hypothetical protein
MQILLEYGILHSNITEVNTALSNGANPNIVWTTSSNPRNLSILNSYISGHCETFYYFGGEHVPEFPIFFEIIKRLIKGGGTVKKHIIDEVFYHAEMFGGDENLIIFGKYLSAVYIQQKYRKRLYDRKKINTGKKALRLKHEQKLRRLRQKGLRLPDETNRHIASYMTFGKKVLLTKALKNKAKKLKIRLTVNRNGKRVYKSEKVLRNQISNTIKH